MTLQTREENIKITSEFSNRLNYTFDWFNTNLQNILYESFVEFWGCDADIKLLSISENTNFLAQNEEFFVTQIRLNKELSVFIRLSKELVKNLLERILGSNGKTFNIEKISELEAKILTGFDNFLYKNFSHMIKQGSEIPRNNSNYNECNLTFFAKSGEISLGKIIIKIPVAALSPQEVQSEENKFDISDFLNTQAEVDLSVGYTRIRLNELKSLEKDDIVVLEHSKSSKMILKYDGHSVEFRVTPNPAIMIDYEIDEEGANSKGDKHMSNDIYNMWDTIQVEIGAEFEKIKMTLGELKQISEGLVVDIGSVYDNHIDLKVEDKIVASGELVIINDRYGVRINQIFTEEKEQASMDYEDSQQHEEEIEQVLDDDQDLVNIDDKFEDAPQTENTDEVSEEDFDYSDFDVDDEDI